MQHYNYSLTELENMMPWEREIYLTLLMEWIKKEEEERKNKKVSINSNMSEPTLTDVTQVLLKQNQELTVNTAETKTN